MVNQIQKTFPTERNFLLAGSSHTNLENKMRNLQRGISPISRLSNPRLGLLEGFQRRYLFIRTAAWQLCARNSLTRSLKNFGNREFLPAESELQLAGTLLRFRSKRFNGEEEGRGGDIYIYNSRHPLRDEFRHCGISSSASFDRQSQAILGKREITV